ncbi:acetyl-CoA acetyltransferase [Williamsia maris]|uniref:Acetyl-CoA C-acetyltransferase n=1 Tax=Williamsia maris TaxID=72806 RepID=A0ABT1H8M9_9NOCA|nr:acetyl-CoA acetyltransferase [Williamsia maris]MCP2174317.1 acetyl-CoA C-acetyltransferase [Williamsia maris]
MADPSTVPVIIGVSDLRSGGAGVTAEPREPAALITEATDGAIADTGVADLGPRIDTIYAVKTASWSYDDLPGLIGRHVGAASPQTHTSSIGGHWPAALLDRIGAQIAAGTTSVALLIGGESAASTRALSKAGLDPIGQGWLREPGGPPDFSTDDLGSDDMRRANVVAPTRVYPLFENRFGHDRGLTPQETLRESATMYARFSEIAAEHPVAWTPTVRSADEIATVGPRNRSVSDTYPLMMNAMPFVDQAAAVIICSLAVARELGVAEDRVVHLWGGAGATDTPDVVAREHFGHSPALTSAVDRTLAGAGITGRDVGIVDAYSCFPIVPKLLLRALDLPDSFVPSVLGGHCSFGGPLNSYSLHAVAEITRLLRAGEPGTVAMVHANGGYLTYQHTVLLSRAAHPDGYIGDPEHVRITSSAPELAVSYDGDAEIVTATVEYDRDGTPKTAVIIAETADGRRVAGHTDPSGAAELLGHTDGGARSLVGIAIHVIDRDGRLAVTIREEAHT